MCNYEWKILKCKCEHCNQLNETIKCACHNQVETEVY